MFRFLVFMILPASVIAGVSEVACSQEVPLASAIHAEVSASRKILERGFHAEYEVSQRFSRKDCGFAFVHVGGSMAGDRLLPYWRSMHATKDARYFHRSTTDKAGFGPEDRTSVSDGENHYSVSPSVKLVSVHREGRPHETRPVEELYMELIGFETSRWEFLPSLRGHGNPHPFDLLQVLGDRGYSVQYEESSAGNRSQVVVLEKPGVERIWLDQKRGFVITKRERKWNNSDVTMTLIENSAFVELAENVWLPQSSRIDYYAPADSPCAGDVAVTAELSILKLSLDPPESLFYPDLDGIVQVHDITHGPDGSMDLKQFNPKGVDGSQLTEYLKSAPEMLGANPNNKIGGARRPGGWRRIVLLINLLGLFIVVLVLWVRKKAK